MKKIPITTLTDYLGSGKIGMKIGDIIILGILITSSFIPLFIFSLVKGNEGITKYVVVRINGKEVDCFNLDKINHKFVKYYPAKGQYNIIEIKDGKIRDKEDNSPD